MYLSVPALSDFMDFDKAIKFKLEKRSAKNPRKAGNNSAVKIFLRR